MAEERLKKIDKESKQEPKQEPAELHEQLLKYRDEAMRLLSLLDIYSQTYYTLCDLMAGEAMPEDTPMPIVKLVKGLIGHGDAVEGTLERAANNYRAVWLQLAIVATAAGKICNTVIDDTAVTELKGLTDLDKLLSDEDKH